MLVIIFSTLTAVAATQGQGIGVSAGCPDEFVRFADNCYALIVHSVPTFMEAEKHCNGINNGHLLNMHTEAEYKFIMTYKPFKTSQVKLYGCPWVGLHYVNGKWKFTDGKKGILRWEPREPSTAIGRYEPCGALCLTPSTTEKTPMFYDVHCKGTPNFICKSPILPTQLCAKNAELKDGVCFCKKGYVDILETDIPEGEKRNYSSGEKCISLNPCEEHSDSLPILFIIDSSKSIGEENWQKLLDFLEEGGEKLPQDANIGFIKFSDSVTSSEWIQKGWNLSDFHEAIPRSYDKGATNVVVALVKAKEMLERDSVREKVAVLITDGTPYAHGIDEKTINEQTEKAVKELKDAGVRLVVMGYGPRLIHGMDLIKSWVEDEEKDFFEYPREANSLNNTHMCYLLSKVCRKA